jgi:hypothetical protein
MSDAIQEAKRRLPLPALMHRLGLGPHAKKSAHCTFHDDQRNSFSVYKNGSGEFRFKCFAGCGEGDEITFLEKHYGISNKEATKLFLEIAGVNGATPAPRKVASAPISNRHHRWTGRRVLRRSRTKTFSGSRNGAATQSSFAVG